ncbi:MAG TPA: SRPBCC domain-containing protein [Acidimicrobiales bacterium]|nr:SRPBCC domain-containing protein [Acidimicrobiales bacterium]
MNSAPEPDRSSGTIAPFRRPPVRQSTLVRSDLGHTFDTFVRTIGVWWPVCPFSAGQERVRDVTIEQRAGGQVFETWTDGTVVQWGELLAWEPPDRFVMTWVGTPVATEVELTFSALGPALTRVSVAHRGWEALTEEQLGEDCALPGGYKSGGYSVGWARILASLAAAAAASASAADPAHLHSENGNARVTEITDDFMNEMRATTRQYCIVILKEGPNRAMPGVEKIIWEHGRRNFSLRADGRLSIVCPVTDGSEVCGVGIFNADAAEVATIMDGDPGVQAGVFVYEVHRCRSFPGDALPYASAGD